MKERNRPTLRTSTSIPLTTTVRMDELKLGNTILTTNPVYTSLVDVTVVTSLRLVGDDVEVNGEAITSSRSNLVTILV